MVLILIIIKKGNKRFVTSALFKGICIVLLKILL